MSPTSVFAKNNTALITGGASGIGLAVAALCRKHGMKVAIADFNGEYLSKAKGALADGDGEVETFQVDVSREGEWRGLKEKVEGRFGGGIDFLMLNAGVGGTGSWGDGEYFKKIFDTNLYGVINGLNTFVPLKQDKQTAIVITGSKQGITNPPGNPAYNASKAAVKTLAEHLSYDLKDTKTSVHLLVPGWTFTGLTGGHPGSSKEKPAGAWAPEQLADYLYKKMDAGKFYVICPDNDVTEEMDKKRMLWTTGDIVKERPPLTRWREEYKEEAEKWMAEQDV
ncbi:NAD(P)-binding protein [Aulographum hederae CBS 113979]|uniref:NAD(P)-binding protein n=1 Tax=Aulographum hederae CBS 113979 TaxID=1176131 RepID=A0A6G1GMP1_9PEZI|nr:NAD(P)-binding protein [Aulographum hederae CBS 113979]